MRTHAGTCAYQYRLPELFDGVIHEHCHLLKVGRECLRNRVEFVTAKIENVDVILVILRLDNQGFSEPLCNSQVCVFRPIVTGHFAKS